MAVAGEPRLERTRGDINNSAELSTIAVITSRRMSRG